MIHIEFKQEEIDVLNYERYHHPHPRIQKKCEVLYLKSQEVSHQEICRLCRISPTTLTEYLKHYKNGGLTALKTWKYKGQPSELNKHADSLETYFQEHPPRSIPEAQAIIEEHTGIKRSPSQIREFLKRLGLKRLKVGMVPGKATNPDKLVEQEQFKKNELEPRLEEAKEGNRHFFL